MAGRWPVNDVRFGSLADIYLGIPYGLASIKSKRGCLFIN